MAKDNLELRSLLRRYEQGQCTPAEKQRVEAWYRRMGTEPAPAPPEKNLPPPSPTSKRPVPRFFATVAPQRPARAGRVAWWAAVVAMVLLVGSVGQQLGWWHPARLMAAAWPLAVTSAPEPTNWQVYTNASGFEAHVVLPDGSAVTLAPASTLKYPPSFRGPRRVVHLAGEAFFDVYHDARQPFAVVTDHVVTTVLGTRFRVRDYAGQADVQVQVRAGSVRVAPRATTRATPDSLVLLANQQAVYVPAAQQLRRELVADPVLIAPQSFVFDNRPVAEVLTTLSDAYGVDIVYDAQTLRNCTLRLRLGHEPLFAKLDLISKALGASYEKADGRILFHSQPCPVQ